MPSPARASLGSLTPAGPVKVSNTCGHTCHIRTCHMSYIMDMCVCDRVGGRGGQGCDTSQLGVNLDDIHK